MGEKHGHLGTDGNYSQRCTVASGWGLREARPQIDHWDATTGSPGFLARAWWCPDVPHQPGTLCLVVVGLSLAVSEVPVLVMDGLALTPNLGLAFPVSAPAGQAGQGWADGCPCFVNWKALSLRLLSSRVATTLD